MIDNRDSSTPDEAVLNLSAPRFDDEASAHAQPVQPIPERRISALLNRLHSFRGAAVTKFSALTLVVIAGLLTGMLGGMTLVKVVQATDTSSVTTESMSEVAPSSNLFPDEPDGEVVGVQEMRIIPENRIRKHSSGLRLERRPHAYLVDVLRR
jgi:hypothetical protein